MRKVLKPEGAHLIADIMTRAAVRGDIEMIKLVWGYAEGLPLSRREVTGKGGGPLQFGYHPLLDDLPGFGFEDESS